LPSIALSFGATAMFARFIRTEMLDVLEQDYIITARAKGLNQFQVLMAHAVRNSIIPVVTILGPIVVNLLTGSLAVESIFSVPGIGSLFVESIKSNDYATIMGLTIFYSAFYILVVMIVDILYSVIDPRIRIQGNKDE
jgi:oligopeptide transport system permease protein